MIYGKLSLEDWQTARVEGEEPESSFDNGHLRLFFYGKLYNRDSLQESPEETNARIAASLYLNDNDFGFSRLDGSFTIVYYTPDRCGIVRDLHGTHYPIYALQEGYFSSSWQYLEERHLTDGRYFDPVTLSAFLQHGLLKKGRFGISDIHILEAGKQFHILNEASYLKYQNRKGVFYQGVRISAEGLEEYAPDYYRVMKNDLNVLRCDYIFPKPVVQKISSSKAPGIEACSRRYGELHTQAIRRRIGDSKRVGILLSGGYDSGANLAALRSIYDGRIDSYSVGFKGDRWTELPMARLMSETFGTRHHEYEIDGTEINSLPDIVRFLGAPFVEGGLMVNYCAMRMIGDDKPEVILGGDGSDQYFGTAGREVALHFLLSRTGLKPLARCANHLLNLSFFDTGGKLSRVNFHLDRILHLLDGERFGFSDNAVRKLLQNPNEFFVPEKGPRPNTRSFDHLYTQHALASDVDTVINRVILYKASRMAQMFGNNLTFPFMDLDLYRFLQELPVSLKCKGDSVWKIARGQCISKYLLKYHYKPLLPEPITSKRKQGGFAPMPLFFRDPAQRARLKEFILSSTIYDDYLRRDSVEKFLTDYDLEAPQENSWFWHRQNKALQYFNLLTLVTWWEQFYEESGDVAYY